MNRWRPTRRGWLLAGLAQAGTAIAAPAAVAAASSAPFEFVALGDMPYGDELSAGPAYRQLIARINAARPDFVVHVGDFKDGLTSCSDAEYARQAAYFRRFEAPLVYTPGDNDWLDCQRRGNDPLERLQALRQRFFQTPGMLGQRALTVQRQADAMPAHARYVENLRWQHAGVLCATFHTVGPDNGFEARSAAVREEARDREAANAAWLRQTFELARDTGARALLLFTQAETLERPDPALHDRWRARQPFAYSVGQTLVPLAQAAAHPVLLVHGDHHHWRIDQPLVDAQGKRVQQLWRLEVFGDPRMHAVRVRVQPEAVARGGVPFRFAPVWNPLSPDPRLYGG